MKMTLFLLLGLLPLFSLAQQSLNPLSQHIGKDRVILIFTAEDGQEKYVEQLNRLDEGSEAFKDRNLIVYKVIGEYGEAPDDGYVSKELSRALRKGFGVGLGEFSFILIGKDGGIKWRSAQPVAAPDVYKLIDSMPMRQREMRERHHK